MISVVCCLLLFVSFHPLLLLPLLSLPPLHPVSYFKSLCLIAFSSFLECAKPSDTATPQPATFSLRPFNVTSVHIRRRWVSGMLMMERLGGRIAVVLRLTMTRMLTLPETSKMLALMAMPGRLLLLGMNRMVTTDAATVEAMIISHVTALSPVRVWPASTAVRKGKQHDD
ncbi:hypothetical protein BDV36DRAFT_190578 [Aspergillus pseudocaelatus]|uniref:Secreted protein n=1 Tax=Aspergillus pseudocaelatus TaxID=1825620 RepID=A0ABQ6WIQ8_9EURO|nr:hypothetical protein BDV36DRAFT_190578 [Aspergillus pseudocaelatus]